MDRAFRGGHPDRRADRGDELDPVVEGARHGLAAEVSRELWESICREVGHVHVSLDAELGLCRFHRAAARVARLGGRLRPVPGKVTRGEATSWDTGPVRRDLPELAPGLL